MISKQCEKCAWLFEGGATCYAYAPDPIPEEIAKGMVGHDKERGDEKRKGVVYMPLEPD